MVTSLPVYITRLGFVTAITCIILLVYSPTYPLFNTCWFVGCYTCLYHSVVWKKRHLPTTAHIHLHALIPHLLATVTVSFARYNAQHLLPLPRLRRLLPYLVSLHFQPAFLTLTKNCDLPLLARVDCGYRLRDTFACLRLLLHWAFSVCCGFCACSRTTATTPRPLPHHYPPPAFPAPRTYPTTYPNAVTDCYWIFFFTLTC